MQKMLFSRDVFSKNTSIEKAFFAFSLRVCVGETKKAAAGCARGG